MQFMKKSTSVIFALSVLFFTTTSLFAETEPLKAYLFAYFTGNAKTDESIHFALSDDAHTFKALNKNNPVLSSATISSTGGVRDPHILRGENNDYYMVATDMVSANGWASNRGLVMLRSTNLIDWKSGKVNIPTAFSKYASADRVWAPQVIFDPAAGKYMVYFAMRLGSTDFDKLYYAYADSTFTKLETEPKQLYAYGTTAAIDADIIYKDSTYRLFFKTEGSSQKGIKSATSRTLTGPYTLFDKYLQATSAAVEGSCVFKLIDSDTFILMYDVYTSGKYEFAVSTDLQNFTKDPQQPSFDFTPRHGTIIPITENEKWALLAKWNPTEVNCGVTSPAHQRMKLQLSGHQLSVSFPDAKAGRMISVVDLSGKSVLRQAAAGTMTTCDVSLLPAGVYTVFCQGNGVIGRFAVK